jgi:hypothetical protein
VAKLSALQQHQGTQVRRNHRHDVQDHPLGLVAAVLDLVDGLEPLGQVLDLLLAVGLGDGLAQFAAQQFHIQLPAGLDRLGAHGRLERVAVLAQGVAVLSSLRSWPSLQPVAPRRR